jgi:hypothetical protein
MGGARSYYVAALHYFEQHGPLENAAQCERSLALLDRQVGRTEEALEHAVRAAVRYDQLRYQLRSPVDRQRWLALHSVTLAIALGLAHTLADTARIAALVESARIQGVPTPTPVSQRVQGRDEDVAPDIVLQATAVASIESGRLRPAPQASSSPGQEISLGIPAVASALGEEEVLSPPHGVCVSVGSPSLAGSVGLEDLAAPVAVAGMANVLGGDAAWWWGSWAAGGSLHWFLLGPKGELHAEEIAIDDLDPLLGELANAIPEPRRGELADTFLRRMSGSPLLSHSEATLAWRLGQLLLPPPLLELLRKASAEQPISLVVAPAPEIASVPVGWLAIDEAGTRVLERAVVRLGASIGLLHEAMGYWEDPAEPGGTVAIVDPGTPSLFGTQLPAQIPSVDRLARDLASHAPLKILTSAAHLRELASVGALESTIQNVRASVSAPRCPAIVFYLGHAQVGDRPARSALVLSDGVLTAEAMFHSGGGSMARRLGLIACGGARQQGPEWLGLAPAALFAGARVVLAALWNLIWISPGHLPRTPTYDLAWLALEILQKPEDPAVSWREVQQRYLQAWRQGDDAAAPLYWAGIGVVGFRDPSASSADQG